MTWAAWLTLLLVILSVLFAMQWNIAQRSWQRRAKLSALRSRRASKHNRIQLDYTDHSALLQSPPNSSLLAQIVFAIPTIGRPKSETYLQQTVDSMLGRGVRPAQIWLMRAGGGPHKVYQQLKAASPGLVEVWTPHQHTRLPLNQSDPSSGEEAAELRRVNEARDFIFLMREVVRRSDAPFIAYHQDVRPLPASLSLYPPPPPPRLSW